MLSLLDVRSLMDPVSKYQLMSLIFPTGSVKMADAFPGISLSSDSDDALSPHYHRSFLELLVLVVVVVVVESNSSSISVRVTSVCA